MYMYMYMYRRSRKFRRYFNKRRSLRWQKLNARKILSRYIYNVNRGQVAKIKHAKKQK